MTPSSILDLLVSFFRKSLLLVNAMRHSFELEIVIGRPVEVVYEHLAQPANWVGLQPLLASVSPVARTVEHGRVCLRYTTTERFRFGGRLKYDNPIAVRCVLAEPNARMESFVRSFPRLALAATYRFLPAPQGTRLVEAVTIDGTWLLMPYVAGTAMRVQRQTLANLKARLERSNNALAGHPELL